MSEITLIPGAFETISDLRLYEGIVLNLNPQSPPNDTNRRLIDLVVGASQKIISETLTTAETYGDFGYPRAGISKSVTFKGIDFKGAEIRECSLYYGYKNSIGAWQDFKCICSNLRWLCHTL